MVFSPSCAWVCLHSPGSPETAETVLHCRPDAGWERLCDLPRLVQCEGQARLQSRVCLALRPGLHSFLETKVYLNHGISCFQVGVGFPSPLLVRQHPEAGCPLSLWHLDPPVGLLSLPWPTPQLLCPECCSGCPLVLRPPVSANHLSISQLKTPPSTSFHHSQGVVHTPQPGVLGLCRSGPFSLSSIVEATLHSPPSLPHTPPDVWFHSMHHHLNNPLHTLFQLPGMLFHGLRVKQIPTHPSESS